MSSRWRPVGATKRRRDGEAAVWRALFVALLYTGAAALTVTCLLSSEVAARLFAAPWKATAVVTLPLLVGIVMFALDRWIGSLSVFHSPDQ
jgi:hypothetical protein